MAARRFRLLPAYALLDMVNAQDAFDTLRRAADDGRLDALCERRGVRLLSVFDSVLDAAAEPGDLDVGVSFRAGPDLLALIDDLTALTSFDHLDVAVLDGADPVLRSEALTGFGLYEDVAGAFAEAQMHALSERYDTEWLRRLSLKAMAERSGPAR